MSKDEVEARLLGKQVWCIDHRKKHGGIRIADHLIPVREHPYALLPSADFDKRVVGICKECLTSRNEFQQKNTEPVDVDHVNLVNNIV